MSKYTPWTQEEFDRMLAIYAAEKPTAEALGLRMNRSPGSIASKLKIARAGGKINPAPKRGRDWSAQEVRQLTELRKQELLTPQIARMLGRSRSSVRAKLKQLTGEHTQNFVRHIDKRDPLFVAALNEREYRRCLEWHRPGVLQLGDPLPGYSALDRREVR